MKLEDVEPAERWKMLHDGASKHTKISTLKGGKNTVQAVTAFYEVENGLHWAVFSAQPLESGHSLHCVFSALQCAVFFRLVNFYPSTKTTMIKVKYYSMISFSGRSRSR